MRKFDFGTVDADSFVARDCVAFVKSLVDVSDCRTRYATKKSLAKGEYWSLCASSSIDPDALEAKRLEVEARCDALDVACREEVKSLTYKWTDNDKALALKLSSSDDETRRSKIIAWFAFYGLNVSDTSVVDELASSVGNYASGKAVISSNGESTQCDRAKDLRGNVYTYVYRALVKARVLTKYNVPEYVYNNEAQRVEVAKTGKTAKRKAKALAKAQAEAAKAQANAQ